MVVLDMNVGPSWKLEVYKRLGLEVGESATNSARKQSRSYIRARAGYKRKRSNAAKEVTRTAQGVAGVYNSKSTRAYT